MVHLAGRPADAMKPPDHPLSRGGVTVRGKSMLALLTARGIGAAGPAGRLQPPYHLLRRVVLGGEGKWDCLTMDPVRRRVFIDHATEVLVVDADSATVIGRIPDTPG